MELTFECPACGMIDHTADVESAERAVCRHCGQARRIPPGTFDAAKGPLACPICEESDFYVRKDFSTAVGLAIVMTGFVAAAIFWYHEMPSPAYLTLGAAVLLDMALYRRVPDVVVCRRCSAQIRGEGNNPGGRFRMLDLGANERLRRERPRVARPAEPGPDAGEGTT